MGKFDVLDYKIEITKDDNGDYIAKIPKLGCIADGKTIDEAINELKEVAENFLRLAEEDGKPIPMPEKYEEETSYSGKLTLRMPKSLHKMLAEQAIKEECSINQLILTYISIGLGNEIGNDHLSFSYDRSYIQYMYMALQKEQWKNDFIDNGKGLFIDIDNFYSRLQTKF
jgi:predicted RNase H-like HicB family nuclease